MKTNARGSGMKTFLAVIFSVMLTFTMMPALPFMTGDVHAATTVFHLQDGDVTISDYSTSGITVAYGSNGTQNYDAVPSSIILTSNGNATNHTVSVTTTRNVTIILSGLNIDVSGTADNCAFSKTGTGELTVSLAGNNYLKSGKNHAGLEKNGDNTGKLIIQDDTTGEGVGSLTATSGTYTNGVLSGDGLGAGIGGKYYNLGAGLSGENITILSGKITAKSSEGAGIGGGCGAGKGGACKSVNISGGNITATSTVGAGIGGGRGSNGGDCGTVTINGGSVTA